MGKENTERKFEDAWDLACDQLRTAAPVWEFASLRDRARLCSYYLGIYLPPILLNCLIFKYSCAYLYLYFIPHFPDCLYEAVALLLVMVLF